MPSPQEPGSSQNRQRLTSLLELYETLSASSPDDDLRSFAAYFAPSAKAYLYSMRDKPAIGRDEIVQTLRSILLEISLDQGNIITLLDTSDGAKVIAELQSTLDVLGTKLNYPQTLVATFDSQGLIEELKTYACQSHMVAIKQKATDSDLTRKRRWLH